MRSTETSRRRLAASVAVLGALLAAASAGWTRAEVRGESMVPALRPGDRLLVRRGRRVRRGEVVVVRAPDGRRVVKRLVAVAGDVADLPDGPDRLGAGEVAVAGDRPAASTDSRHWGPLPRGAVVGRVVAVYHPPERAGWWASAATSPGSSSAGPAMNSSTI